MAKDFYTPSEVAAVTGITTAMQRNYRHRGVALGRSGENGRHVYRPIDVMEAGLFAHFKDNDHEDAATAMRQAHWLAPVIASWASWGRLSEITEAKHITQADNADKPRFVLLPRSANPVYTDNLLVIPDLEAGPVKVFVVEQLIEELPAKLRMFWKACLLPEGGANA